MPIADARQSAHRLYKQSGDSASAARMAIWLACDYLDFDGAFTAITAGWRWLCEHMAHARRAQVIPFRAIRDDGVAVIESQTFADKEAFLATV